MLAHQIVAFELDGGRVNRHLGRIVLEALRQFVRPEDRQIRLRRRAKIGQRMQDAEVGLRDPGAAICVHAAKGNGDPGRIAGEQRVEILGAQVAQDAALDHELIDDFLCFGFGDAGLR